MRKRIFAVAFIALGWATTLATPMVLSALGYRIATGPDLPYLLSYTRNTDVRSSPMHFLVVVGIAALGCLIAEAAKVVRPTRWVVVSVFVFQMVLVLDCVRAYARDWWSYFVVVGSGQTIEQLTWMDPVPVSGVTWPWISACLGSVIVAALSVCSRTVPTD